MLFAFRRMRFFQFLTAISTCAVGIGGAFSAKAFSDQASPLLFFSTGMLVLIFFWLFMTTLRAPTSFLAISPDRTRIRFAGFVDTVVDNRDILGARVVSPNILQGIGVRTNFRGRVSLASTWGEVAEIEFRRPIRIWLIPRLIPLKATKLQMTLKNPGKVVERFGPPPAPGSAGRHAPAVTKSAAKKAKKRAY